MNPFPAPHHQNLSQAADIRGPSGEPDAHRGGQLQVQATKCLLHGDRATALSHTRVHHAAEAGQREQGSQGHHPGTPVFTVWSLGQRFSTRGSLHLY